MAIIRQSIKPDLSWANDDQLQLVLGTEEALDLASSTPAGGTVAAEAPAWPDPTGRGGWGADAWGDVAWGASAGYAWGAEGSAWGDGIWGISLAPARTLETRYRPTDKCAVLPIGVRIRDALGNASTAFETFEQLLDRPVGARDQAIAATANPNEAALSWTASPDV